MKLLDGFRNTRWLARADDALQAGDLEAASDLIENVLDRDPNNTDALHLLGRIHFFRDHVDRAEEIYARLREMDPSDEIARENLRQTHLKKAFQARESGDIEDAAREFNAALDIDPNDAFTHYNLGCAYSDFPDDHTEDALAAWRKAVALNPDYTEAHFDLGQVYFYNERYDEAQPHFEAILDAREDWPAPHYCLAVISVKSGDLDTAMKRLKDAIIVNTGWAKTAAEDKHLAPLRDHPDFEEIVAADTMVRPEDLSRKVLTREDLLRDMEEFADWKPDDADE